MRAANRFQQEQASADVKTTKNLLLPHSTRQECNSSQRVAHANLVYHEHGNQPSSAAPTTNAFNLRELSPTVLAALHQGYSVAIQYVAPPTSMEFSLNFGVMGRTFVPVGAAAKSASDSPKTLLRQINEVLTTVVHAGRASAMQRGSTLAELSSWNSRARFHATGIVNSLQSRSTQHSHYIRTPI